MLPCIDGTTRSYALSGKAQPPPVSAPLNAPRRFYSAAHVVADPKLPHDPAEMAAVDWDCTLAYRDHLYALGLSVADAMDTAQRGMGLAWPQALELIQRSARHARAINAIDRLACGAGTDHLPTSAAQSLSAIADAYAMQCEAVEATGARVILMASRALAATARGPDDYAEIYGRILEQVTQPVILHWLGDMFDPALAGYWGHADVESAMECALSVISSHAAKIDGIKISLLSAEREVAMRRRLPPGVRMYSGDDFNYPDLIAGDDAGHSDALLGIFDPIAPAAAAALVQLCEDDRQGFHAILDPTLPLARHIFTTPTRHYKTGIVLLAWLNGHQNHFLMMGGQQGARSTVHLAEVFRLADQAGLFADPEAAAARMRLLMALHGVN